MTDEKVHKPKAVPLGPARHARRRALHPVLALRALLRRDHRHRRAGHLPPRRSLGDRPVPRPRPRQQVLGQRRRHLPGGRPHRPRLPVPGARVVPGHRQVDLHRDARAAATSTCTSTAAGPTTPRGAGWPGSSRASTPTVNAWWMCDEGRYGFGFVDAPTRLTVPTRRSPGGPVEASWDEAVTAVADALRRYAPEQVAVLASAADGQRGPDRPAARAGAARASSRWASGAAGGAGRGRRVPPARRPDAEHAGAPS